ncbi:MAG: hypothetical protein KGH61_03600 [Candidatus Micrarchaeota archaeon]|nr:hypothetical protein [Candidatus Micrarchaeota archaeon]MDE1848008.1 hypothetical protein [Candidatus Micrarchaeota archaeon]MDE1864712.1 hypothetical protein [Candidatus Micrarchaeota archaeon]
MKTKRKNLRSLKKQKSKARVTMLGGFVFVALILSVSYLQLSNHDNVPKPAAFLPSNQLSLFVVSPQLNGSQLNYNDLAKQVLPTNGFVFPIKWNKIAQQLVTSNALNVSALSAILNSSGEPLTLEQRRILNGTSTANVILNNSDAAFVLDLLWGVGINNNNPIINNGPVMQNGDPYNFASTGGYTPLGNLQLGKLNLVGLTSQQQMDV